MKNSADLRECYPSWLKSLNVQVSQNKFLLGICKQSKLLILVMFACFKSDNFFSVGFFVVNYSHKAARHVCFCVFICLAVAFYTTFISVAQHRHDMSRFKSTSVEYSYGCGSKIEGFVYVVDNSACSEITFIFLPRVFSPTTMLSYQTSPFPDDFGH